MAVGDTLYSPYEQVDSNITRPGQSTGGSQMPNQLGTYINYRPNQHFETITGSGPQYTHPYARDFDHYDSPANISRDYEIPLPLTVFTESLHQRTDEGRQRPIQQSTANISRDYEIPLPLTVFTESSNKGTDEAEQAPDGTSKK